MFGNSNSSNPFSTMSLDELQRNYQMQMDRVNSMKQTQQATIPIMEEINRLIGSMTTDEQSIMMDSHEYQLAKNTYEQSFMGFLSGKFAQEYMMTPDGKLAAEGLLSTIRNIKDRITYEAKVKREKVDKMLELLDNDPEMKARYEQLTSPKLAQSTTVVTNNNTSKKS